MYLRYTHFTLRSLNSQSKTERSLINFAKEPNLAPEPGSGQPCYTDSLRLTNEEFILPHLHILQSCYCLIIKIIDTA